MNKKIQVTINDSLYDDISRIANTMGLSISSTARYLLKAATEKKCNQSNLDKIIAEDIENISLDDFNARMDSMINA